MAAAGDTCKYARAATEMAANNSQFSEMTMNNVPFGIFTTNGAREFVSKWCEHRCWYRTTASLFRTKSQFSCRNITYPNRVNQPEQKWVTRFSYGEKWISCLFHNRNVLVISLARK